MDKAKRTGIIILPDPKRVLFRPFKPGNEQRIVKILARINILTEENIQAEMKQVLSEFGTRHQKAESFFMKRFEDVKSFLLTDQEISKERQLLIGAYFTQEYSLEHSALFNPSMIWHPDQNNLQDGTRRFIISLRATGEGHISSITFRSGIIDGSNNITLDKHSKFVTHPDAYPNTNYEKALFKIKLSELHVLNEFSNHVLSELEDNFTLAEISEKTLELHRIYTESHLGEYENTSNAIIELAQSNYEVQFSEETHLSERVIFPFAPNELNGIEDARFVQFHEDNDSITFYATYTAYNGRVTFPQLLETKDFLNFKINTLNGAEVHNKGMALFPRKINGQYVMLSRQDGENIYIMYSSHINFWREKQMLLKPTYPWEYVQLGNCGSPIETEAGWLVLSHGVGPMRKYAIGAFLLDINDPSHIIGRLKEPLLTPDENEREGYVPNVVYSCGGVLNNRELIIPYAMSDYSSSFATINLDELLHEMLKDH